MDTCLSETLIPVLQTCYFLCFVCFWPLMRIAHQFPAIFIRCKVVCFVFQCAQTLQTLWARTHYSLLFVTLLILLGLWSSPFWSSFMIVPSNFQLPFESSFILSNNDGFSGFYHTSNWDLFYSNCLWSLFTHAFHFFNAKACLQLDFLHFCAASHTSFLFLYRTNYYQALAADHPSCQGFWHSFMLVPSQFPAHHPTRTYCFVFVLYMLFCTFFSASCWTKWRPVCCWTNSSSVFFPPSHFVGLLDLASLTYFIFSINGRYFLAHALHSVCTDISCCYEIISTQIVQTVTWYGQVNYSD